VLLVFVLSWPFYIPMLGPVGLTSFQLVPI
jgi:hypothetical protein